MQCHPSFLDSNKMSKRVELFVFLFLTETYFVFKRPIFWLLIIKTKKKLSIKGKVVNVNAKEINFLLDNTWKISNRKRKEIY